MFSFTRKTKNISLDWMGVDIHSHLLPGLDDGVADVATSVAYIKKLYELGIERFICTPHIFRELYPNNKSTIIPALESLLLHPELMSLPVKIEAAGEYMMDSDFSLYMKEGDLLCLPGNHLLIEMSYIAENPTIFQSIFEINVKGYKPILAHPERYGFYHRRFDVYKKLKDLGCLFQLNMLSVTGYYGNEVKQIAMKLIKEELVEFIGTDLHHMKHLDAISEFVKSGKAYSLLGTYPFKNREIFKPMDKL